MPYCSRCGVEVSVSTKSCPLCRATIQQFPMEGDEGKPYPDKESPVPVHGPLSLFDKLRLSRTITTIGFLIPFFITLSVDLFLNQRFTWSAYVLAGLTLIWVYAIMPLFFIRRPFIILISLYLATCLFLFFLNIVGKGTAWSLELGIPLVTLVLFCASLCVAIIRKMKRKGANVSAVILVMVSILCAGIDFLLNWYSRAGLRLSWSLIVVGTGIPVEGLLFYVHYISGRHGTRLKRFFHF